MIVFALVYSRYMPIDTHCHVQFQAYKDDREAVLDRCAQKGMILNVVGTQKDTSRLAVELAEKYENLYASIGTHPNHLFPTHIDEEETHFMSREEDFDWEYYAKLAESKKVIGVGETGLDLFHLPPDVPVEQVLAKQKKVFLDHARFAYERNLPLIIHCREAHDQMIELLQSLHRPIAGTVHCYTSNWNHAEAYLALGLHLGFTGVITFPPRKSHPQAQADLLEVVKRIPTDRMLLETDAPYLAPIPYRGERAEPWMVSAVAQKIAEIKNLSLAEVLSATTANAERLFRLKK